LPNRSYFIANNRHGSLSYPYRGQAEGHCLQRLYDDNDDDDDDDDDGSNAGNSPIVKTGCWLPWIKILVNWRSFTTSPIPDIATGKSVGPAAGADLPAHS
jgi:hypothetical protein